jgi:lipoprotein-anchoring transpeptidase ErfK/SrfK
MMKAALTAVSLVAAGTGSVETAYAGRSDAAPAITKNAAVLQKRRSDKSPIPRQIVRYDGNHAADTIIVNTTKRLYYTLGNGQAIKYGVGVGREGFAWAGTNRVSRMAEWPG